MKILFNDSTLFLYPESENDKKQLKELLGEEYSREPLDHRDNEFSKTYGSAVYKDGEGVRFEVSDSWWNYDD